MRYWVLVLCLLTTGLLTVAVLGDEDDALLNGGARLGDLQNNDGGWDWPLNDGNPANASPLNTVGPIAMGLSRAYWNAGGPSFLAALADAGGLLLSKTNNFSPSDGYLAVMLDSLFDGTTYRDHVQACFYGPLAAGTYNRNGLGTLYSTASYVELVRSARAGTNLAEWDIGMGLVGALACGATDATAWINGIKAELNEHDSDAWWDVIGLAGAVYGLARAGVELDPTSGDLAAASNLRDLANVLAGYQINGGGFSWNANYLTPGQGNETTQETAYAILALSEFERMGFLSAIQGAVAWLVSSQIGTGGWENYVGDPDGENNELTGEALWGIHAVHVDRVWVSPSGNDAGFGYGYVPFATIQRAVSAIEGLGGAVVLAPGTYVEGPRIDIHGDVDIAGAGASVTTVKPAGNTGSSGDSRAWFLVDSGATLDVSGVTFDGDGNKVYQAFRWKGDGTVVACTFTDIQYEPSGPSYSGVAIAAFENGDVDVTACRFEQIGRVGVLYFGPGVADAQFSGNTYIGKGDGDWLDYALDISAGAHVDVLGNEIRDNRGVASVDGSTSAGVLVTTYYGDGTASTILLNTIHNNTTGIAVGYDGADTSTVLARYNSFSGNEYGVYSTGPVVDAILNWWGDATGPAHGTNPGGTGDAVSDQVIYSPWLGTNPDADPNAPGVQLVPEMLIIVAPVGPEPTDGYFNAAVGGANELPGADTIQVQHGTYNAETLIKDSTEIVSQPGSAAHTTLTGNLSLNAAGIRLGRPGLGFSVLGNITAGTGIDASTIHINWNNLYANVINNGNGTLDALYNFWGTRDPLVIDGRTIGDVGFDPFLPMEADASWAEIQVLLATGFSGNLNEALDALNQFAGSWMHAQDYMAWVTQMNFEHAAAAYQAAHPLPVIEQVGGGGGAAGGGGGAGGTYQQGDTVELAFAVVDPATGEPVTDLLVTLTVVQVNADGTRAISFWGLMAYDSEKGGYALSYDTSALAPGEYDFIITLPDGQSETVHIVITG